jgi:hypothetical protein
MEAKQTSRGGVQCGVTIGIRVAVLGVSVGALAVAVPGICLAQAAETSSTEEPRSASAGAVAAEADTSGAAGPSSAEPSPASGQPTEPVEGSEPAPSDEPAAPSDEPAVPSDEPAAPSSTSDEPEAPLAQVTATAPPAAEPEVQYGLGVHLRGIFVPTWLLNLFLDASTPLNSAAVGAEFVRRKGEFDIIGSIDFGFYSPRDGNYLGNGDDPATETDYLHFDGLNALGFSVHFIKHEEILPWLSFVWGGGVGLAVVLGDIFRASSAGCNEGNLDDLDACSPRFDDYSSDSDAWIKNGNNYGSEDEDSIANPKLFKEEDVPPVIPIVHLLVGFNFKITDFFAVRLDGGFRNAFYVGATGHYFF